MSKLLLFLMLFSSGILHLQAQITIEAAKEEDSLTTFDWVKTDLQGEGIQIINFTYEGNPLSLAHFKDSLQSIGLSEGILITTGIAEQAVGPNGRPNAGANFGDHFFNDPDLCSRYKTCDGAILTIDFIPNFDSVYVQYVYASEEYPEFVNNDYNDLFSILLKPLDHTPRPYRILSILENGDTVSVKTINGMTNANLYIDNHDHLCPNFDKLEYDGYTKPLIAAAKVFAGKSYRMKVAIADVGDCEYDSGLFLRLHALNSTRSIMAAEHVDSLLDTITTSQGAFVSPVRQLISYNKHNDFMPDAHSIDLMNQFIKTNQHLSIDSITVIAFRPEQAKNWKGIKHLQKRTDYLLEYLNSNQISATIQKKKVMKSARHFQTPKSKKRRAPLEFAELLLFSH